MKRAAAFVFTLFSAGLGFAGFRSSDQGVLPGVGRTAM